MKLSVSLPEDDVEFMDEYVARTDVTTRSAVLRVALELLRAAELEDAYSEAWDDWAESPEAAEWDVASGDGLTVGER